MKQKFFNVIFRASFIIVAAFVIASCQSRNTNTEPNNNIEEVKDIELNVSNDTTIYMLAGESFNINYTIKKGDIKILSQQNHWNVSITKDNDKKITVSSPSMDNLQGNNQYDMIIGSTNPSVNINVKVHFKVADLTERGGVYLLSEGNMTTENGSIAYITPDGGLIDTLYKRVNGTELGNVAQDMCIHDGKAYIICQNGESNAVGTEFANDGMLIIVDLKTFRKIKSYKKSELSKIEWPTHLISLDGQNIYIRAKNGIWHLDNTTGELTPVENITPNQGSGDYMPVNNTNPSIGFVVLNNKIYYASYFDQWRSGIIKEITPGEKVARDKRLPMRNAIMVNKIVDLMPSDDGKLWVLGYATQTYVLFKFDVNAEYDHKTLLPYNVITEDIKINGNSHNIAFIGDRVFFLDSGQTVIYDFVWDKKASPEPVKNMSGVIEEWLHTPQANEYLDFFDVDGDARSFYNGLAINPVTKKLYVYTLKDYALWNKSGKVFELNTNETNAETIVNKKWTGVGRFAAGFFFNK